jgi:hypothetical protein
LEVRYQTGDIDSNHNYDFVKVYIRNANHCYKIMMVSGRSALFCIMVVATLVITSDPSMFYPSVHILKLEGSENVVKN